MAHGFVCYDSVVGTRKTPKQMRLAKRSRGGRTGAAAAAKKSSHREKMEKANLIIERYGGTLRDLSTARG